MYLQAHPSANCRDCGGCLWYGTKAEAASWKVFAVCRDGCGREWMVGRIKIAEIEHRDEVNDRAKALVRSF